MWPQIKRQQKFSKAWLYSRLVAVLGAPILIWLPKPIPEAPFPLIVMLAPIMIGAYLDGFFPALLGILSSIVTVELFERSAYGQISHLGPLPFDVGRWVIFLANGLMLGLLMEFARRARQQAEANKEQFASTLANIDEAVIVTTKEGLIEYINPAAALLSLSITEDAPGRLFDDVFHIVEQDAQSADQKPARLVQLQAATQLRSDRYVLFDKSGRRIPLEVTVKPIREDGSYTGRAITILRDCSARLHTERALRERIALQEQLATIARMLPGALYAVRMHPNGLFVLTYASPSFADVYGLDPDPLRSDATAMGLAVHPDDVAYLDASVQRAAAGLTAMRLEHRVIHPRKGTIWIELYSVPLREADGSVLWNGIFFDVTQRKLAEQALKQSEARLLGIVDSAIDGIVTVDNQRGIVVFNPAAERMFRCPEAGMLGTQLERFVSNYLQADSALLLDMLKRDEISELRLGESSNLYGQRSDGETFPVELSFSRSEVDGHRLLTMTVRDITARKRAADRLQASQLQLHAALEAGAMGIIRLYIAGREVEFDEQALELCGVQRAAHLRQPLAVLLHTIHPDDRMRVAREYFRAISHHQPFRTETRVRHEDGSEHWLVFRGRLVDDGAHGAQLTAIVTDITYRKQFEEQRLRSQKLESLGVLAGGIAHDFNNLLLAITGNLKLASADIGEHHAATTSLSEIAKAAARATNLVRRILAFSRPQDHKREPVLLGEVLEEVLGLARAVLPASIVIRIFTAETSPLVLADATQVHQALINLLTNAADAVAISGGEIEVHLDVIEIDTRAHEAEAPLQVGRRYARVTVSDNGSGMDTTTLQRIFDPFYTTKPLGQGTGLGLAIVHGIMKSHEGAVTVHSEVGRGSSFALYFPVHLTTVAPPAPPTALPAANRAGRILYVDDEESLVYLMTRTLQRLGHQVSGRTSPDQALTAFMQDPDAFDLVVTDMSMPGMSGLELAGKILAVRPQLSVIITTGFVRAEDYQAASAVGVRQLILKPNTIEELGTAIQCVLQGQEAAAPVR